MSDDILKHYGKKRKTDEAMSAYNAVAYGLGFDPKVWLSRSNKKSELLGFSWREVSIFTRTQVCAQCEGELKYVRDDLTKPDAENRKFHIFCPECGMSEKIGRVSMTTVAIRAQQSVLRFPTFLENNPDLWGELLKQYKKQFEPIPISPKEGETKQDAAMRELGF